MPKFGWFGDQEHRVFNYRPIYFDEEKEKRRQMFGRVDGSNESKDGKGEKSYSPGAYLHGAFRGGNYAKRRGANKAQSIIGLIGLILVGAVLFMIAKFYTLL